MDGLEISPWRIDQLLRPLFRRFSKVGDKVYFNNNEFSITKDLEANFDVIRSELDHIMKRIDDLTPFQEISPDQKYISSDDKWKMFF
jgi:beta-hydroxylase